MKIKLYLTGVKRALLKQARQFKSAPLRWTLKKVERFRVGHLFYALLIIAACELFLVTTTALLRVRLISPHATPIFEDRKGTYISEGEGRYKDFGFWDMPEELPERLEKALLAIEDKRFYRHNGVDLRGLGRAILSNLKGEGRQGGSTIAMQLSRMQYPAKRTIHNKLVEALNGRLLVLRYGHERVLRHYMKLVPQGNRMHGFAYASRRYFRKPPEDLSWAEAAMLASLPKAPGRMNLFKYDGYMRALKRARLVLKLLYIEETLDQESYRVALNQLNNFNFLHKEKRSYNSYHYIIRLLEQFEAGDKSTYSRPIRTTLDFELQELVQHKAFETMQRYRQLGAGNIAVMVVDRENGDVLAYLGSEDYFDEESAGAIDYARTPRSSGSTLKPFLFALGMMEGSYDASSIIADLPIHIIDEKGEYNARNYDEEYLGPMLYRRALANSRNIPTIKIVQELGVVPTYELFADLGLHNRHKEPDHYGYGIALGGLYVKLEDLVRAYGVLANDGRRFELRWLETDSGPTEGSLIPAGVSRQLTLFLSDPLARLPSFPRLKELEFPFPVAIKTGTSQGFRDAWAMAYSSKYIVGLWMGHPDNHPMNHLPGSAAAGAVRDLMIALQPEESKGINEQPFPQPADHEAVKLCILSGRKAEEDCPMVFLEYFEQDNVPAYSCNVHQRHAVNRLNGELATSNTPPHLITTRVFTVLPPEYAAWGAANGYGRPPADSSSALEMPQISLKIVSPPNGGRYIIDPEIPLKFQTLALRAEVTPAIKELDWYVNGKKVASLPYPYQYRWPLKVGKHLIEARFPGANVVSQQVRVEVRE